jgi:MFS family permease
MTDHSHDPKDQFRRLAVLIGVAFIDMIGFMLVLPVLPFYALNLHATPVEVGLLMAAFSIAQLMSAPLWGRVSDRFGRRPALLIGLAGAAIAYVVFGFAHTLWLLFASRFVQGAGGGTTGVAQAYVADSVRPADRARALGWLSSASSAGVVLGPIIGTFAQRLGTGAPGFIAAGLCVMNIAFAWWWLPESKTDLGVASGPPRKIWAPAWEAVRRPRAKPSQLIWIYGMGMLAFSALTAVLPLYLNVQFGVNEHTFGYFLTYFGTLSVLMRIVLLGPIVRRYGERGTMRIGCVVLIAGFALYPVAQSVWVLAVLVMPLVPIGTALLFPSTTSLLSSVTPKEELGVMMGVAQTFAGIARVVAPILSTWAFQAIGHSWSFTLAAALIAIVSVMAFHLEVSTPHSHAPVSA